MGVVIAVPMVRVVTDEGTVGVVLGEAIRVSYRRRMLYGRWHFGIEISRHSSLAECALQGFSAETYLSSRQACRCFVDRHGRGNLLNMSCSR